MQNTYRRARVPPAVTDDQPSARRGPRAVLAAGVCAGLAYAAVTVTANPAQVGIASDVYFHAGRALLAGGDPYAATPPDHPYHYYLYPPVVTLFLLPHAFAGSEFGALLVQTALTVAAGLGTAAVLRRALVRRGVTLERIDVALLAGFALLSVHAVPVLVMGQVTLLLAFALAVGVDALEGGRGTRAGVAFALAALVKLFPATVGAWLLRRRADRAVAAAVATGLGGLAAGAALLGPDLTLTYAHEVLPAEFRTAAFAGTPSPERNYVTVRRQLAALLPVGPALLPALAAAVLAVPLAFLYRDVDGDVRGSAALLGTLVATLLFLPLEPLYFPLLWYPLVVLCYELPPGRARGTLLAGTLGTYLLVDYGTATMVAAALPPDAAASLLGAARVAMTVVQPPAVGLWLLLAGAMLAHRDAPGTA